MPTYLFYPHLRHGAALVFEVEELRDDAQTRAHAREVLARYGSSVEVKIWRGERMIARVARHVSNRDDSSARC